MDVDGPNGEAELANGLDEGSSENGLAHGSSVVDAVGDHLGGGALVDWDRSLANESSSSMSLSLRGVSLSTLTCTSSTSHRNCPESTVGDDSGKVNAGFASMSIGHVNTVDSIFTMGDVTYCYLG